MSQWREVGQPRTVLEQKIRERRQTFEEFIRFAEEFAREHGEDGTLSVRHLQRLAAGRRPDGRPLGPVRPATARLLERIFGTTIDELLSEPAGASNADVAATELRWLLSTSRRVDQNVIDLFAQQLDAIRRIDRQLGAVVAYDEVLTKARQAKRLRTYSTQPAVRAKLAALLSELYTLAGWQALDLGSIQNSWRHYEDAKAAAAESGDTSFIAHAAAEQSFVLLDLGQPDDAVELLDHTRAQADRTASNILRAWLAAAHGEALAAAGRRGGSLRAFDNAAAHLERHSGDFGGPYVALDAVHLARWRGHALARFGDAEAVRILLDALNRLDPSFTRAETGLRVDLASAFMALGESEAARFQVSVAQSLAAEIGSARQVRRLQIMV